MREQERDIKVESITKKEGSVICKEKADTRQQQNRREGEQFEKNELKAVVVNISDPKDLPVGTLTRCLFGMSLDELAAEISVNKNGKWNDVYT